MALDEASWYAENSSRGLHSGTVGMSGDGPWWEYYDFNIAYEDTWYQGGDLRSMDSPEHGEPLGDQVWLWCWHR